MGLFRRAAPPSPSEPLAIPRGRFSAADERKLRKAFDTPGQRLTPGQVRLLEQFEDARAGRRSAR